MTRIGILPCLLLPLHKHNLLLPSSAVAEVIPYVEPKTIPDIPGWLLGILSWRGTHIPLTYLEQMEPYLVWSDKNGDPGDGDKRRYHIAIINRIYKIETQNQAQKINRYPFFAIVLRNAPKLYRLTKESVTLMPHATVEDPRFIIEFKIQNETVFIPNLVGLWKIIDTLPSRLQWFRQVIA